jgi:hypothetical protein
MSCYFIPKLLRISSGQWRSAMLEDNRDLVRVRRWFKRFGRGEWEILYYAQNVGKCGTRCECVTGQCVNINIIK